MLSSVLGEISVHLPGGPARAVAGRSRAAAQSARQAVRIGIAAD
jgi:hypothetical protein